MNLSFIDLIEKIGDKLSNLLFPPVCIFCGEATKDKSIVCEPCKKALKKQISNKPPSIYSKNTEFIEKIGCVFPYNDFTKASVLNFKSSGNIEIVKFFGELLYEEFKLAFGEEKFDLIVPVPMYRLKKLRKGFNQSELIGKALSKKTKIPLVSDALIKPKHKKEQKKLSGAERRKNAKNAYECPYKEKILGKTVLLIDDVTTTGSTLNECARVLLNNGAKKVSAIVIASTVLNE